MHEFILVCFVCSFVCLSCLVLDGAFSVGYNFQYWHKNRENYINPKYDNLKDEIFSYEYLNIDLYDKEIIPKSKEFHQTHLVKSIKCLWNKYGIKEGDVMSVEMLICIILYCDYTELSRDFSSTFRKNNTFEPIQSTKKRNQKYYHMARILKEMIYCYGQTYAWGGNGLLSSLVSPFYCGMSFVMMMPQFNIKLYGPTSTSNSNICSN